MMINQKYSKKFSSDYHPTYKKQRNFFVISKRIFYFIIIFIIIFFVFYLIFFSAILQMKQWEIIGFNDDEKAKIEKLLLTNNITPKNKIWQQYGLIRFDSESIKNVILQNIDLEYLEIKKNLNSVKIIGTKRQPVATLLNNGQYYNIDRGGVVLDEIKIINVQIVANDNTAPEQLTDDSRLNKNNPLMVDLKNQSIKIEQKIFSEKTINAVLFFFQKIPTETGIKIKQFLIPDSDFTEIFIETVDGWQVYMEANNDWQSQIDRLKVVYDEKIKNKPIKIEYIDLRADNGTVFIK